MQIRIDAAVPTDAPLLASLACELLQEIIDAMGERVFEVDQAAMEARATEWLAAGKTWMWVARHPTEGAAVGFLAAYEGHALYAEGAFGTISELFVRPAYRSRGVGAALVEAVRVFGRRRGWSRLEVTTPPLPAFDRTFAFYAKHGFVVSGGRKMRGGL